MNTEIFSYKNFKGLSVKNKEGDTLGDVHDVVMDLKSGQIAYLVLASGGFLGIGEKYLPVPYESLEYNPKSDSFLMDVPKDKFKNAPHIDMKSWPNRPDNRYVEDVYSYYGYQSGIRKR